MGVAKAAHKGWVREPASSPAFRQSGLGDQDPQGNVNQLSYTDQAEDHKGQPDNKFGDAEACRECCTDTCDDLAIPGSNQG